MSMCVIPVYLAYMCAAIMHVPCSALFMRGVCSFGHTGGQDVLGRLDCRKEDVFWHRCGLCAQSEAGVASVPKARLGVAGCTGLLPWAEQHGHFSCVLSRNPFKMVVFVTGIILVLLGRYTYTHAYVRVHPHTQET